MIFLSSHLAPARSRSTTDDPKLTQALAMDSDRPPRSTFSSRFCAWTCGSSSKQRAASRSLNGTPQALPSPRTPVAAGQHAAEEAAMQHSFTDTSPLPPPPLTASTPPPPPPSPTPPSVPATVASLPPSHPQPPHVSLAPDSPLAPHTPTSIPAPSPLPLDALSPCDGDAHVQLHIGPMHGSALKPGHDRRPEAQMCDDIKEGVVDQLTAADMDLVLLRALPAWGKWRKVGWVELQQLEAVDGQLSQLREEVLRGRMTAAVLQEELGAVTEQGGQLVAALEASEKVQQQLVRQLEETEEQRCALTLALEEVRGEGERKLAALQQQHDLVQQQAEEAAAALRLQLQRSQQCLQGAVAEVAGQKLALTRLEAELQSSREQEAGRLQALEAGQCPEVQVDRQLVNTPLENKREQVESMFRFAVVPQPRALQQSVQQMGQAGADEREARSWRCWQEMQDRQLAMRQQQLVTAAAAAAAAAAAQQLQYRPPLPQPIPGVPRSFAQLVHVGPSLVSCMHKELCSLSVYLSREP